MFDGYASACSALRQELMLTLTEEEIDLLRRECTEAGHDRMIYRWRKDHAEVCKYVSSSASQRRRAKWSAPGYRAFLVWAAIQHVDDATRLLCNAAELEHHVGCSWRQMANLAGEQAFRGLGSPEYQPWPFSPPNPFEADLSS